MMQFKIIFIDFVNFYVLLSLLLSTCTEISADSYNVNYNNPLPDSANLIQQQQPSQLIKPVGGYGHPKLSPRLTQEQIDLPNPYLVNGNPQLNQINCEGVGCEEPSTISNIEQIYNPYNYVQQTATNVKSYNNLFPYGDISVNSMIDGQYHELDQQQQQQQPSFNPNIKTNLPTSSTFQNNFFNRNQQSQNTFNQETNQQPQQYGSQMENSNYKIVVPHVSNNNVDINFILEQQNEHLRVLLENIKQQQLKLMQTIIDIQHYFDNLPTKIQNWSEKHIIENQQNPINFHLQPVRNTENIITNRNDNGYFNDLSKNQIQNQQSVRMP